VSKKHPSKKGGPHYSSVKQHRLERKVLSPPLKALKNIRFFSWMNERLPDVLWAVLLAGALPREQYLSLFRAISDSAANFRDNNNVYLTHSALAKVGEGVFETMMGAVVSDEGARIALAPLRLFATLPDIRALDEPAAGARSINSVGNACRGSLAVPIPSVRVIHRYSLD
jgi:hypothetical protein